MVHTSQTNDDAASEPRVTLSSNAERLSDHVTLYKNAGAYQIIVQVVGTSRADKLEALAAEIMDAAATLRARQTGANNG